MHSVLNCPNCNLPLEIQKYDLHAVEYCHSCKGMLVDATELHEHVQLVTKDSSVAPVPEVPTANVIRPFLLSSTRKCPRDGTTLRYINYGYDSNVVLEECKTCRVLWVESNHILPLARYLKSRPELLNLGETMDRNVRHQNLHENVLRSPHILLSDFPMPLGDTTHTLAFPWIMLGLIGLQVILFLMKVFLTSDTQAFLLIVSLIPENIKKFESLHTLITHQLFHADMIHLIGNLFTLWIFGDNVESRMGPKIFLAFYLMAGALAGVCAALFAIDPLIPMIGASGAISAVLGSYMVLYPKEKVRVLFLNSIWGVTVWKYMLFWIIIQMIGFIAETTTKEVSSISFAAHVFGFIFGIGATLFLKKTKLLVREVNFYEDKYFKQD